MVRSDQVAMKEGRLVSLKVLLVISPAGPEDVNTLACPAPSTAFHWIYGLWIAR
jgi:hypothetical protein